MTFRIGIVSESDYDFRATRVLLEKNFANLACVNLARGLMGGRLDCKKAHRVICNELRSKRFNAVICVRDLDACIHDTERQEKLRRWFDELMAYVEFSKAHLLVHIYEHEALLFTDTKLLENIYGIRMRAKSDVRQFVNPKELLMRNAAKGKQPYSVSHLPRVIERIEKGKLLKAIHVKVLVDELRGSYSRLEKRN